MPFEEKERNLPIETDQTSLSSVITEPRYVSDRLAAFDRFQIQHTDSLNKLTEELLNKLFNQELENKSLEYPDFGIPSVILSNNSKIRCLMREATEELHRKVVTDENATALVRDFLSSQHENIKWSLNQWLLVNPGQTREISKVDKTMPVYVRNWLSGRFGVNEGDIVLNRHVISHGGQSRLKKMGFDVPYSGLHESYYREAMKISADMIADYAACTGVMSEGSWLYSPDNYNIAPDGSPFVRFTFLADDELVGERLYVSNALQDDVYVTQYAFATRDKRREQYAKSGIFQPKVYAAFYSRKKLLVNSNKFL